MDLLRLFIVEDEWIILEGLVKTYPWASYGFTVVGTAMSGEEALEKLPGAEPDVVLTDIRMRGLSGLDLMQREKARGSRAVFIVISAFRDFEYAKSACDMGAFSYLVKPVDEEQIRRVMQAVREHCGMVNARDAEYEAWRHLLVDNHLHFQENIWERFLGGSISSEELRSIMKDIQLPLSEGDVYCAACADLDIETRLADPMRYEVRRFALMEKVRAAIRAENVWRISISDQPLFLCRFTGDDQQKMNLTADEIRKLAEPGCILAISDFQSGADSVPFACTQALEMLSIGQEAGGGVFTAEGQNAESEAEHWEKLEKNALLAVQRGSRTWAESAVQAFAEAAAGISDAGERKLVTEHLLISIGILLRSRQCMNDEMLQRFRLARETIQNMSEQAWSDALRQTAAFAADAMMEAPSAPDGQAARYIETAVKYISEHLSDSEMMIGQVADAVYLNQAYFGRIFKQVMGMSFRKYLLQERMNLARHLLESTDMEIQDLCQEIGMLNPSYFTQTFKAENGILPTEYRQKMRWEGSK